MTHFNDLVAAFIATQHRPESGIRSRLRHWCEQFGDMPVDSISCEDVDLALEALIRRGKLHRGKPSGRPLAPSSVNRYLGDLAMVFKFARRERVLPRNHVPPTLGVEKLPEVCRHDRYFTAETVDQLIAAARVTDLHWRRLCALIRLAYTTGLRKSNLLELRWRDIDFARAEVHVPVTKNGQPHVAPLTEQAKTELLRINDPKLPDTFVFAGPSGRPLDIRRQWNRAMRVANLTGLTFHSLRHGCGHALAQSGESQGMIMRYLNHQSLTAAARYMHASSVDKQRVAAKVFT